MDTTLMPTLGKQNVIANGRLCCELWLTRWVVLWINWTRRKCSSAFSLFSILPTWVYVACIWQSIWQAFFINSPEVWTRPHLFTEMESTSLYSIVRDRVTHWDQFAHNKSTCNEREQGDSASRRDSPSHYSVIDGTGHTCRSGSLK